MTLTVCFNPSTQLFKICAWAEVELEVFRLDASIYTIDVFVGGGLMSQAPILVDSTAQKLSDIRFGSLEILSCDSNACVQGMSR